MKPRGWHSRGFLPHFDGGEVVQFITVHLGDATPLSVVRQWKAELENEPDERKKQELYWRVEKYLDQGMGNCYLGIPEVAAMIQESLTHHDGKRYKLIAWVIMPNHIHYLIRPHHNISLSEIMQKFKSYTFHEANRIFRRTGQFWQVDYFDRYIRNYDHFVRTLDYINLNPVKAGLCGSMYDWPFGSGGTGWSPGGSPEE